MIKAGQHYMPTGPHRGLVVILGEDIEKKGWYFNVSAPNGFNKDSHILTEHLIPLIEGGQYKLIYDPPDGGDHSVRNRLSEIE